MCNAVACDRRVLRELAGVEQHDFINQLCGDQALRLLNPPGHTDAMFFLTADERFLVRTITRAEQKLLLSLLQRYAEHLQR
jgi:1-phosphatidylinositol-4-phosphate 5-kinase